MAYSAFGINYDTAAKISAYGGDAETPAQPIWAEDTHQLWIVHGTAGKYRVAMASELSAYLTTANASATYLSKADAASTYLGINAKAKTAGTADTVPWTGVSDKPNLVRSVNGISPRTDGNVTIPISARMMPNYGSYVQIGAGDYTPSEDGWLRLENMNSGDYTGGKVIHKASGALILEFYQNRYPGNATMMLPVRAGETYTVTNPGKIYFHKMM